MDDLGPRTMRRLPHWYRARRTLHATAIMVLCAIGIGLCFPWFAVVANEVASPLLPGRARRIETGTLVDGLFDCDVIVFRAREAVGLPMRRAGLPVRWPLVALVVAVYGLSPRLFASGFVRPRHTDDRSRLPRAILGVVLTLLIAAIANALLEVIDVRGTLLFREGPTQLHFDHRMPSVKPWPWVALWVMASALAAAAAALVPLDRKRYSTAVATCLTLLAVSLAVGMAAYLIAIASHHLGERMTNATKTVIAVPLLTSAWCWLAFVRLVHCWPAYRGDRALCDSCGYDLRGTVQAGRDACPECGHSMPSDSTANTVASDARQPDP